MASLPVFWPYLRRNIDRIMITHEVEVKVTEQHHFVDSHSMNKTTTTTSNANRMSIGKSQGGGGSVLDSRRLSRKGGIQLDNMAYTPWMDSDGISAPPSSGVGKTSLGGIGRNVAGLTLGASAAISDPTHTKAGEVVMMRDLGRATTDNTDDTNLELGQKMSHDSSGDGRNRYRRNHHGSNASSPGEMDLPFDGTRSPEPRSPNRAAFLTRNSKDGLLR